ncbi:MAG: hypothetical protein M1831_006890 [Alyxoria varia]|nr:MAG: hypothetical protein M1831_006890 [Alyxoria varia]
MSEQHEAAMANTTDGTGAEKKGRFEPKNPVKVDPPKDDPISVEHLEKCTGINEGYPTYVAIKGKVYDVTGNKAYGPEGGYHVFAGHDASRALAKTSLKPEDVTPKWEDLDETEKKTLADWDTFFSKRYNVVGRVVGGSSSS